MYRRGVESHGGLNGAASSPIQDDLDMLDATDYFERGRIKQLQDERVSIQKKTFTKWCNSYLNRAQLEIVDLFKDLCDGILLMKLLEIISGDKLGKPNRGRMRVHKIENLNRVLEYLKHKRIQLENIGAEDILDANARLILGLIWTIILRFQIEDIEIEVDESESSEKKFAKDALLLWCQRKTAGYAGVKIDNFTSSWRSGLGFNALIHAHRPDLINFDNLSPTDHAANLNNAFEVAEKKLGIARLLDAEDIDVTRPDEKSVITYVSMYYHYFAKQKSELTGAKRIGKVIWQLMNTDQMKDEYEAVSTELLQWIRRKVDELHDHRFPNSLKGIQDEMSKFKLYRTQEKPIKYKEKGELEVLFFNIRTKQKALGTKQYVPPNGHLLHDIESAWETLERAEHGRQVALHEELMRQERLEHLARNFERKSTLREVWLRDMTDILKEFEFGKTVSQVEASVKKHEAIAADVLPRKNRLLTLKSMADDLWQENYHDKVALRDREQAVWNSWTTLLKVLESRRAALFSLNKLMTILRDADALADEFDHIEWQLKSRESGKHLPAVEDLLQKHDLLETQLVGHGQCLKTIGAECRAYVAQKGFEHEVLQGKMAELEQRYSGLLALAKGRRLALEHTRELLQFMQDTDEEGAWLAEKSRLCLNIINQTEPSALSQIHLFLKGLETEMQGHWLRTKQVLAVGEKQLLSSPAHFKEELQKRLKQLNVRWEELRQLVVVLNEYVKEAQQILQFYQDANEMESWIGEKMPLVSSVDVGKDQASAERMLIRHGRLEEELKAYKEDVNRLEELAQELSGEDLILNLRSANRPPDSGTLMVLEKYHKNGWSLDKGQLVTLIKRINPDACTVRDRSGKVGTLPAQLLREVKATISTNGDASEVINRQQEVSSMYGQLVSQAKTRRELLADTIQWHRFYRECHDFEHWARATERALAEPIDPDDMSTQRRRFDKIFDDINATEMTRLKLINQMVDDFASNGHSQLDRIKGRQREMEKLWRALMVLKEKKSADLDAAERVAQFTEMCRETKTWILEKSTCLDEEVDSSAVQTLQRKHQNLERELRPVDDKMRSLKTLAVDVVKTYPAQSASVKAELGCLDEMWARLKEKVQKRRKALEESQGLQVFHNVVDSLMAWMNKTKVTIALFEKPVDVAGAESLIAQHMEIHSDIMVHKDELNYAKELGERLLRDGQKTTEVKRLLDALTENSVALVTAWQEKREMLDHLLSLMLFIREADRIDAITKVDETFLELPDLGDSVDAVEDLLKQHTQFENKLAAQVDRVDHLMFLRDRLEEKKHPQMKLINRRQDDVINYRNAVTSKTNARRNDLEQSLVFHNFKRGAAELMTWIEEKMRIAMDDARHGSLNLERRLKKHEVFEAELHANEERLRSLRQQGDELCLDKSDKVEQVQSTLKQLNDKWQSLLDNSAARHRRLQQAWEQRTLNRALDDANVKLAEIEKDLRSDDVGVDLRSIKQLLQKHSVTEQEVAMYAKRVQEIVDQAQVLTKNGHYDSSRIVGSVNELRAKFDALQEPMRSRYSKLDCSLMLHQFNFDVECERQWLREKMPMATFQECGRSLTEAINLRKKHEQLESEVTGHQPTIERVLDEGKRLIAVDHFASKDIDSKCAVLQEDWLRLEQCCRSRRAKLDVAFLGHKYQVEASELEAWMNEKRVFLESRNIGTDEEKASAILARHKALLDEIKTYQSILDNLRAQRDRLKELKHADWKLIDEKQRELDGQFRELGRLADARVLALAEAVSLYQYLRDADELQQWIDEQMCTASSEECGQDYEHLTGVVGKFNDFKERVNTGFERFSMCERSAGVLLERQPPFSHQVEQTQRRLAKAWSDLLDRIEVRQGRLEDAELIHRFNRDCADAVSRMIEKSQTMSKDLGKDLATVHRLIGTHEAFEKELAALGRQVDALQADCVRLQRAFPGVEAERLALSEANLKDYWFCLQERVQARRNLLNDSLELQKFLKIARDYTHSTQEAVAQMRSVQGGTVRDLKSVEMLDADHELLRCQIESHSSELAQLKSMAKRMLDRQHYAEKELIAKLDQAELANQEALAEWKRRRGGIDQLALLHTFLRESKQIAALLNQYTVALGSELPDSVESVSALSRKHEVFERKLNLTEDRICNLKAEAAKLVEAKHPDSGIVQRSYADVEQRWRHLLQKNDKRKTALREALLYANFKSDVCLMESWIGERFTMLTMTDEQAAINSSSSLKEKMKRLQKYQTIEAELAAHEERIRKINQSANALLKQGHANREEIMLLGDRIGEKWTALARACQEQSRALEEAKDVLNFEQMMTRITVWIKDTELMVNAGDMGNDYEHCALLLKRLHDAQAEANVDDESLKRMGNIGDRLVSLGTRDRDEVQDKLKRLQCKWHALRASLAEYGARLEEAKKVHAFRRDLDDALERIGEKHSLLTCEENVRNLQGAQLLLRNQDNIERDMGVIDVDHYRREADALLASNPPLVNLVVDGLQQLQESWRRLGHAAQARRGRLLGAVEQLNFFNEHRELVAWSRKMMTKLASHAQPNGVHEAQSLLEVHKERLAEMQGRREQFKRHGHAGDQLAREQADQKEAVERSLNELHNVYEALSETWQCENDKLWRWHELQCFAEQAGQVDRWLATKEAFLNRQNLGNSLDEVDKLLKQHERFETTLKAQSDKIDKLASAVDNLPGGGDDQEQSRSAILKRQREAAARYESVRARCLKRRALLQDSRKWHLFLKTCHDVMSWINQKLQIAYDESYLDSANLQSKLRKHGVFEAELVANEARVVAIEQEASALCAVDHYASTDIQLQLREIVDGWQELKRASKLKGDRMQEAFKAHQFNRRLSDLDAWVDHVEAELSSDDHGTDVDSVETLLKRHELLEQQIAARSNDFDEVQSVCCRSFSEAEDYPMADDIVRRTNGLLERYRSLNEPCAIRKDNLSQAKRLYDWLRAADAQSAWIRERRPIVFSDHVGDSLQAAQNLMKKHQLVEQALLGNEESLNASRLSAERMVAEGHFASDLIARRLRELNAEAEAFKDQVALRKLKLLDCVEAQQYFCDAFEADEWISGRRVVLSGEEVVGQDERAVLDALAKLEQVEHDAVGYKGEVDRLARAAELMLAKRHFDHAQIAAKQEQLERNYSALFKLCSDRRQRLVDAQRYYQYVRQADTLLAWLREKEAQAMCEEYGRDLDHCQALIGTFEHFLRELSAAGERVAGVQRLSDDLLRSSHPFSASVKAKETDLKKLWCDVNEAATERQQALLGARQVHKFDQDADETLNWLQEKEAQIVSESDDVGQSDLITIQTMLQHNDIFMRELAAVERQADNLCREAERLVSLYPDTANHLDVRKQEMLDVLSDVKSEAERRMRKYKQAEELQAYFDNFHELVNWIGEMTTVLTSQGLASDVAGAEAQVLAHREHQAEIDARQPTVDRFVKSGREMMLGKSLLSNEIAGKVEQLERVFNRLRYIWNERNGLYAMNLDAQLWKRDAASLELWLDERHELLNEDDWRCSESMDAVDERIKSFDDFLTTLAAQEEKFEALKKLTLLEQAFKSQTERERGLREEEEQLAKDKVRKEKIKTVEKHKILQERRQERERRRTQEISFVRPCNNDGSAGGSLLVDSFSSLPRRTSVSASSHWRRNEEEQQQHEEEEEESASQPMVSRLSNDLVAEGGACSAPAVDVPKQRVSVGSSGLDSTNLTESRRRSVDSESSDALARPVSTKKTPVFTTRRGGAPRRGSRRIDMMQTIEKEGYVERKHDLQSGGKKATIRSWKTYYTILCGQLICFFKDQESFYSNVAAAPPINILRAICQPASDYQKRKNTFKLCTSDGAIFLFACSTLTDMQDWIAKINFHATLHPSMQLKMFNERHSLTSDSLPLSSEPPQAMNNLAHNQRHDSGYPMSAQGTPMGAQPAGEGELGGQSAYATPDVFHNGSDESCSKQKRSVGSVEQSVATVYHRNSDVTSVTSVDSDERRRRRMPRISSLFKGKKRDSFQL